MAFSLKNIFSKVDVLKASSTGSAIGIDIGTSAIKVVEIKKKNGKVMLETYGAIALGPYAEQDIGRVTNLPPEKIVEALKEVMQQSGVTSTDVAMALPVQSSLIFAVDLPPTIKQADYPAVIPTEARKYIPIAVSEVTLDYFVSPKKEMSFEEATSTAVHNQSGQNTEVIVIALQNDALAKFRTISSQAALQTSFFEIEAFSSIRSNFEHELSLVLLVDLGASFTKLSLVEFGMIKSHHIIKRGGADITDSISRSFSIPFSEAETMKKE